MRITLPSGKWRKRLKIKALPPFAELHKVRAGNYKMFCIKIVQEVTGMHLAEAKALVEQPAQYATVKDGLSQDLANLIAQKFQAIGVAAEVYGSSEPVSFVNPAKDKNVICCPKCGSIEYHAGARGFSLVTGFVGSGKTVLTCLKCGYRWKPGKGML